MDEQSNIANEGSVALKVQKLYTKRFIFRIWKELF